MALRRPTPAGQPCPTGDDNLLSELGNLRFREGYYVDAERYTNMAIACAERALGPDHFAVADLMIIRFRSWCELGHYGEAEILAAQNFSNRRMLHGDDSPAVDSALHHLAHVLYERGKLHEAEEKETEALTRRLKLYGDVHASVATSRMSLGDIQLASGDASAAGSSYQNAITVFQKTLGEDHPNVAEAMRGLAESLAAQDRLVDARAAAEQALAMQRRRLRPGHPAIAGTLVTLGIIAEGESAAAAEPRFRNALRIWHDALPADHPYIGRAESLLGETLVRQHRTAEALPLLRHGLAALRAALPDHEETRRAGERLHRAESPPPWPGAR
jgi:tetratricopeptide (TPR) repeat protein